jgi:hypothetical protein
MSVAEVFMLTGAMNNAKEVSQKIATHHRDLHGAVSKVGKAIDRVRCSSSKTFCFSEESSWPSILNAQSVSLLMSVFQNFTADYGAATGECALSSPECQANLCEAIYNHFLQHGMLDIAESLAMVTH